MSFEVGRYYSPSGNLPPGGLVITVVGGAAAASIVGAVYAALTFFNPFIYFNILATFGYGIAVGWVLTRLGETGKLRAPLVLHGLAIPVGLIGLYVHWMVYAFFAYGREFLPILPMDVAWALVSIAETGVWSFKEWTPTGGVLYALWTIEALIVLGAALVRSRIDRPFCESCTEWVSEQPEILTFGGPSWDDLRGALEGGDLQPLLDLAKEGRLPDRALNVELRHCPHGRHGTLLSLVAVRVVTDSKGRAKPKSTILVPNLGISEDWVRRIQSARMATELTFLEPGE